MDYIRIGFGHHIVICSVVPAPDAQIFEPHLLLRMNGGGFQIKLK
jgi:hypothetical protein